MSPSQPIAPGARKTAIAAPNAEGVAQQLADDIAACRALLALMQAEREALQQRDADTLGQVIEHKVQHLSQLERSAAIRAAWATNAQSASPESAWHQLLHDLRRPELNQQWEELKTLMADCRSQNETNGKLLARSQHTFGRLLNIMRGQTEAPSLYTQKGAKSSAGSSHNLGEA